MRCVIYARYSTELQTEASIADQVRVCREYAAARAWLVVAEYSDRGISGAALGNRPGAREALEALKAGQVLLLNDLSRLSRSQDLAPLLSRLRHRGVRVIGVQDGFDSDSRTARMQAGLSGIMSEEFRAMVADRTRSALELRARDGRATGGKAYANTEIVREIFRRYADGESLKTIASDLNCRDVPSPGASWKPRAGVRGRWLVSALHALLQNELYVGRKVWNKSRWVKDPDTGKRTRRERPESEWIVQLVEPIVDQRTWDRVQARFQKGRGRGGVPSYLLSGLLVCALCGSKLVVSGGSQRRYVCSQNHHGGEFACSNSSSMPRLAAEAMVLAPIERDLLSAEAVKAGVAELRRARAAQAAAPAVEDAEVRKLERLVREGLVSAETIAPALVEARRKAEVRREAAPDAELPWPSEKLWRETVVTMREILRGDDVVSAREVLRELVGAIRCTPREGFVEAELTARSELLRTGTGIWVGSGGRI